MYKIDWNSNVRKCLQSLDVKSRLSFDKYIAQLKEDGCLPSEISIAGDHLFRFQVDNDWVAVAKRQEVRAWWGGRTLKIEILNLLPASEFKQPKQLTWIKKATKAITPSWLVYRRYSLYFLVVMALVATTFAVVGYKVVLETDGVTGKVTIDGRQSQ